MNITDLGTKAEQEARKVIAEMKAGTRDSGIEWGEAIQTNEVTVKEMIGTDDGASDFLEKTTYDVFQGRENVPLLYKDIYTTREDSTFPRLMTAKEYGGIQVVFLEHFEGGEVRFGSIGPGVEKFVRFHTYTAGLEWSEDMVEWNEFWSLTDASLAFGEAYNKLLNHLHLSPIISSTYTDTAGDEVAQRNAQEAGTPQLIGFDTDLVTTFLRAFDVLPAGSKLLVNSRDQDYMAREIAADILADNTEGSAKRRFNALSQTVYDGDEVVVDEKTYTYPGVESGFAYLLVPKRQFTEYIKHDLRLDADNGDLSRLIVSQMVGRARRAVFAGLSGKNGAIKIQIRA